MAKWSECKVTDGNGNPSHIVVDAHRISSRNAALRGLANDATAYAVPHGRARARRREHVSARGSDASSSQDDCAAEHYPGPIGTDTEVIRRAHEDLYACIWRAISIGRTASWGPVAPQ